jgi:hypothetical protein
VYAALRTAVVVLLVAVAEGLLVYEASTQCYLAYPHIGLLSVSYLACPHIPKRNKNEACDEVVLHMGAVC